MACRSTDGVSEFGEVVLDSGLHDGARRIEVSMRKMITYPGDLTPSANWPNVAPGTLGPINALSPKYFNASGIADLPKKPPVLWIRGDSDQIVGDASFFEAKFSAGTVSFNVAKFSGGEVSFNGTGFVGGKVVRDGEDFRGWPSPVS